MTLRSSANPWDFFEAATVDQQRVAAPPRTLAQSDRTATLIARNRLLLASAAEARVWTQDAIARAQDAASNRRAKAPPHGRRQNGRHPQVRHRMSRVN
jgi:hypothetical protein